MKTAVANAVLLALAYAVSTAEAAAPEKLNITDYPKPKQGEWVSDMASVFHCREELRKRRTKNKWKI